jgi:ATP-dependent exoDNAse (exonuclease V) beta subunit
MRIHIDQLADPLTVQFTFEIRYLRHHNEEPAPMEIQENLEELSKLCWHRKSYGYNEMSKEYWKSYKFFKGARNTDEKKALYVAMTRTYKNLYILYDGIL